MKRIIKYTVLAAALFSISPVFAFENNFDGKIGGAWAVDPAMPGLDISANYQWVLDPFFSAGVESGLFWIQWDQQRKTEVTGQSSASVKATTNAYSIPVLATAQIRLPNLKEKISLLPYISIGLGYSFMPLTYSDPSYTDKSGIFHKAQDSFAFHTGFTWKVAAGAAYTPSGSSIAFLGETGFIGAHLYSGNTDRNMSRIFLDLGVRFTFGK
jgi:hypothetical protein